MILMLSTGVANAMAGSIGLKATLESGDMELRVYAGTMPVDANNAIGAATLLCVFKKGSLPLVWSDVSAGILSKPPGDIWSGVAVATGLAVFGRFVCAADADDNSLTAPRLQGDVATIGAFINLDNPYMTTGASQTINSARMAMPRQ